jgi:hypothetical protein
MSNNIEGKVVIIADASNGPGESDAAGLQHSGYSLAPLKSFVPIEQRSCADVFGIIPIQIDGGVFRSNSNC